MRYILQESDDAIMFGRYQEALAAFADRLPPNVATFARDERRFMLDHEVSLHDAWLQRLSVFESRASEEDPSEVKIEVEFLGQGGGTIRLTYGKVATYHISGQRSEFPLFDSKHGDVYTHEVRVSDDGLVVHEILFVSGSTIEIECAGFEVEDMPAEEGGEPGATDNPDDAQR